MNKFYTIFATSLLKMIRLLIFIGIVLALDFYALQSFRSVTKNPWVTSIYVLCSILVLGNIVYQSVTFDRSSGINHKFYTAFALFVLLYVPKFILIAVMFGEDVFRLFEAIFNKITSHSTTSAPFFKGRRKVLGQLALGLQLSFLSILYGITKGKYNFKVLKYTLFYDDLPPEFDGYKITQISDIHSGSFDKKAKIDYAIDLINEQESDVIMFTGDLVNSKTSEMDPWKPTFQNLVQRWNNFCFRKSRLWRYTRWPSKEDKEKNFQTAETSRADGISITFG